MNLTVAIELIELNIGQVITQSSIYVSEAWGKDKTLNEFYNNVIQIETELTANKVLEKIELIEQNMGRLVKSKNRVYKNRIIDIDILLYDMKTIVSKNLIIPHRFMLERLFVLEPLNEIAPEMKIPTKRKTVSNSLKELQNVNNSKIRLLN